MAFKMKGMSHGEGTGSALKQSRWAKFKSKVKKQFSYDPEQTYAGSAKSPADYTRSQKQNPRYIATMKRERERYDAGETLADPSRAKKFKAQDEKKKASKAIDAYAEKHLGKKKSALTKTESSFKNVGNTKYGPKSAAFQKDDKKAPHEELKMLQSKKTNGTIKKSELKRLKKLQSMMDVTYGKETWDKE